MAVLSRFSSRLLLGGMAVLLLAFSLSWLVAAQKLGDYLHERAFNGAAFADFCTTSEIGGFPFRLKLTCSGLKAPVNVAGVDLVFKADQAKGVASIWSPNHVVMTFSSPVSLQSAEGGSFAKLRHDGATMGFAWGVGGLTQAEVSAHALDWRPEVLAAGPAFNAQSLVFVANPSVRDGVPALHVEAGVEGLTAPLLQTLLKDSGSNALLVSGDLYPLLQPRNDWWLAVDEWRKAEGTARIDKGEWRWGALKAQFAAALSLDDAHRLAGTVNVNAHGAEALAARLGLPLAPGAANALLGALLGQKPPEKVRDKGDDTVALTFRLTQGGIFLGPLKVGGLAPLY